MTEPIAATVPSEIAGPELAGVPRTIDDAAVGMETGERPPGVDAEWEDELTESYRRCGHARPPVVRERRREAGRVCRCRRDSPARSPWVMQTILRHCARHAQDGQAPRARQLLESTRGLEDEQLTDVMKQRAGQARRQDSCSWRRLNTPDPGIQPWRDPGLLLTALASKKRCTAWRKSPTARSFEYEKGTCSSDPRVWTWATLKRARSDSLAPLHTYRIVLEAACGPDDKPNLNR